jgi:hypothetical protein
MIARTWIDNGFGFPLGFAAAVAATVVSIGAGATRHHGYSLGMLVVVVAVVAAVTTMRAAMGTAAVAWALHAGFVLGRLGQLVFTPESAYAAMALAAVVLISSVLATALTHATTARHGYSDHRKGDHGKGDESLLIP